MDGVWLVNQHVLVVLELPRRPRLNSQIFLREKILAPGSVDLAEEKLFLPFRAVK